MANKNSTSVPQPVVLRDAPEKYDSTDQREVRRVIMKGFSQLMSWGSISSLPDSVAAVAGVTGEADTVPYFTSVSAMALASLTPFARTILADISASAMRTTLGLHDYAILAPTGLATDLVLGDATVGKGTEDSLTLVDVTTLNVTTAQHGLVPKAPNDVTQFLNGTGVFSVPPPASIAPTLGTFPSISGLSLRLSAELSARGLATDGRVGTLEDMVTGTVVFAATSSLRPRWHPYATNGIRPGIIFDGVGTKLTSTTSLTFGQPFTVVVVMSNWGRTGAGNLNLWRDSNFNAVTFISSVTTWAMFAGGTPFTDGGLYQQNQEAQEPGKEGAMCVQQTVYNSSSSVMANNGVEVTGDPGNTLGINGNLTIGGDPSTSISRLNLYEFLIFNKALSPTERGQLNTYYAGACLITL